jgi:hypothetical protein
LKLTIKACVKLPFSRVHPFNFKCHVDHSHLSLKQISMTGEKKLMELILKMTLEIADLKRQLQPIKKQKYYSYKEAAEMLCLTVDGLKTRIKRGQMARVTNNQRPLIAHKEIMRFLEGQNPDGLEAFQDFIISLLFSMQRRFGACH